MQKKFQGKYVYQECLVCSPSVIPLGVNLAMINVPRRFGYLNSRIIVIKLHSINKHWPSLTMGYCHHHTPRVGVVLGGTKISPLFLLAPQRMASHPTWRLLHKPDSQRSHSSWNLCGVLPLS